MRRALVFVNGIIRNMEALKTVFQTGDLLIAADGGARHLLKLGRIPHVLIGDLDSLSTGEVSEMERAGVEIQRYPVEKDETDLDLALEYARESGCDTIRLVGALGGRMDQTLANIYLLTHPGFRGMDIALDDGQEEVFVITDSAVIEGAAGDRVSLIPLDEKAEDVTAQGFYWPLRGATLWRHETRGISNVMLADRALVSVGSGHLLCIHTRKEFITDEIQ
ncbi:MAG: thiamine diphosphokinase [Anaerolineaceae bacterium]|nr:thiamine diphosphokinase [Anaerolineaceae bacterium]